MVNVRSPLVTKLTSDSILTPVEFPHNKNAALGCLVRNVAARNFIARNNAESYASSNTARAQDAATAPGIRRLSPAAASHKKKGITAATWPCTRRQQVKLLKPRKLGPAAGTPPPDQQQKKPPSVSCRGFFFFFF